MVLGLVISKKAPAQIGKGGLAKVFQKTKIERRWKIVTTEVTITHILTSIIEGLIRALVGISKSQTFTPEKFKFEWNYFGFSLLVSAIVGVLFCIITDGDWQVSLLAG